MRRGDILQEPGKKEEKEKKRARHIDEVDGPLHTRWKPSHVVLGVGMSLRKEKANRSRRCGRKMIWHRRKIRRTTPGNAIVVQWQLLQVRRRHMLRMCMKPGVLYSATSAQAPTPICSTAQLKDCQCSTLQGGRLQCLQCLPKTPARYPSARSWSLIIIPSGCKYTVRCPLLLCSSPSDAPRLLSFCRVSGRMAWIEYTGLGPKP